MTSFVSFGLPRRAAPRAPARSHPSDAKQTKDTVASIGL